MATKYVSITKLQYFKAKLESLFAKKTDLAKVATSGSYNDLSNKPTIPSVGNGTITITQNGASKGTFTTNQSGNTTIALTDNNTTYNVATTSSNGLMSSSDKSKLDGIAAGATKVTVDSALSSTSTNPIQNKVVKSALDEKVNKSQTVPVEIELGTSWTQDTTNSYYTQTVSLAEINASDTPSVDVVLSGNEDNIKLQIDEWAKILDIETQNGSIKFIADEPTTIVLIIQVKGVYLSDGSVTNYESLLNKPQINGVALIGNKSLTGLIVNTEIILGTSWATDSTNGYVTQTVTVNGITESDKPIIGLKKSGTLANMQSQQDEFNKLISFDTKTNAIKFIASKATISEITLLVKGV